MAWVGTNSTNVLISQGGAADLMWAIKSALLEAGWRLMSYGGGANSGTYQAPNEDGATAVADGLSTAASLNVNGAWFRMKEPGSTTAGREVVFQRGDAATEISFKYSKATGFTGSNAAYAVGEQYAPTTGGGDGQVVGMQLSQTATWTDEAAVRALTYGLPSTPTSGYVQVVASDTADANGVWSFYAWSYSSSSSRTGSYLFAIDGLLPGSHHPSDADPCCVLKLSLENTSQPISATGYAGIHYWHGYGRQNGGWESAGHLCYPGTHGSNVGFFYSLSYRHFSNAGGSVFAPLSPYDGKAAVFPVGYCIYGFSGAADTKWKGLSANIAKFDTAEANLRVFNSAGDNPKISLLAGYDKATNAHGLLVPWVPNKVPA